MCSYAPRPYSLNSALICGQLHYEYVSFWAYVLFSYVLMLVIFVPYSVSAIPFYGLHLCTVKHTVLATEFCIP
jgi:hypothetical protein